MLGEVAKDLDEPQPGMLMGMLQADLGGGQRPFEPLDNVSFQL
jgi:hypothetical protein